MANAPAAGLNSVQVVRQIQQPAYTFNPERFSEITDGDEGVTDFWKLSTVIPDQTQRLWQGSGKEQTSYNSTSVAIGPIGINNDTMVWRRKAPAAYTAKKVTVQLERQSYENRTR